MERDYYLHIQDDISSLKMFAAPLGPALEESYIHWPAIYLSMFNKSRIFVLVSWDA